MTPTVAVSDLSITFTAGRVPLPAVAGLGFELSAGRVLGIVGESGSGKSATARALLGLHDRRRTTVTGSVELGGHQIVGAPDALLRRVRGPVAAMVFQNPLSAMHPAYRIGAQIAEAYRAHHRVSRQQARVRAIDLLDRVGITQAHRRVDDFPHQFSGGMRQRALIAIALANDPQVLIADEPTTALDVTVQAQILHLLTDLQRDRGMAIILITHDLGVVSEIADDVLVMYAGRCVETGPARDVLTGPRMPYTRGLLASVPLLTRRLDHQLPTIPGNPPDPQRLPLGCSFAPRCPVSDQVPGDRCRRELPALEAVATGRLVRCHLTARAPIASLNLTPPTRPVPSPRSIPKAAEGPDSERPLLEVTDVVKRFPVHAPGLLHRRVGHVHAVDGVSLSVRRGESVGLVGETGCGKTTTGQLITRLTEPTAGSVRFDGIELSHMTQRQMRPLRRRIQMIFQDPQASLNPRHSIGTILAAPLIIHRSASAQDIPRSVAELLELVGLHASDARRYPHELSGGQQQRVGIARAVALAPELIVADEPVSSLDVSIQAQIINLLQTLQAEMGIAFLLIAHDLAVVRHFCTRVAVMYLGKIVEVGDRQRIYEHPSHPYTRALLSAVPQPMSRTATEPEDRTLLAGEQPNAVDPPRGCRFRLRCPIARTVCASAEPPLHATADGHEVACHFPSQVVQDA